jgi:replicative DNA helicase
LYEQRQPIDVVTLASQLKKMKKLAQIGGTAQLAELSNTVSTASNVSYYAGIVADAYVKRRVISLAGEMGKLAYDPSITSTDLMDSTEQNVYAISQSHRTQAFVPLKDTLVESFERLDALQKSGGELRGVGTGYADLDHLLAGFHPSNLIILAARPGMGKTALALNIAHDVTVKQRKKVGIFSLEMSKEELVDRLLVSQADIDAWRLKTGKLDDQDYSKLSDAMGVLAEAQIFIDDTPGMSIFEMRTKARRLMSEHKIDLLLVDYLQLARGRTTESRVQEVAEISQGLKNIARELRIPVLALSQLSRAIENRGEKSPQLSDLRESGSIEQDADVVMFIYRKDDEIRESVTLKVAKHRNGSVGEIELFFRGERIKFYGLETRRAR